MARPRYKSGKKKGKFMSNRAIAAQKSARKRKRGKPTRKRKRGKRGNPVARKKRRGRRRSGSGGIASNKKKLEIFVAGTALGYAEAKFAFMQQIPTIQALGADLTKGILLAVIAKNVSGKFRQYADAGAVAYLGASGLNFGRNNFQLSGDHLPGGMPGENQILGTVVAGDMEE